MKILNRCLGLFILIVNTTVFIPVLYTYENTFALSFITPLILISFILSIPAILVISYYRPKWFTKDNSKLLQSFALSILASIVGLIMLFLYPIFFDWKISFILLTLLIIGYFLTNYSKGLPYQRQLLWVYFGTTFQILIILITIKCSYNTE